jgi:ribonuclease Z
MNPVKLGCIIFTTLALLYHSCVFSSSTSSKIKADFNDDKLHIYFCGTGVPDPENQWLRHPSCLAVLYNNNFFLIDSGAGTSLRLSEIGLPVNQISRVFFTHLHSDHFSGLAAVINESWIFGRTTKLPVYGPYGIEEVLRGIKTSYAPDVWFRSINREGLLDPNISQAAAHVIDLGQQNSKQVWQDQQLSLTAHPVHHEPVFPAFGYMLKFKNCNVFVTGDTRVFKKESNIVKNADVVISEAMSHPLQEKRLNKAKRVSAADYKFLKQIIHYHSDSLELAKMAEKANVKHLFLTHLDPSIGITQAEKQDFVAGMDKYYSGSIAVADDMDELVISSDGNGVCQVQYIPANKKN